MFVGTIPKNAVAQALRCVDFAAWPSIYVCCSGSFRWERVLRERLPTVPLSGCDVSIYSVAIGKWLAGEALEFTFRERLAAFEDQAAGADPRRRLAYLLVAAEMSAYRGNNLHSRTMFAEYLAKASGMADAAEAKLEAMSREIGNYSFFAGDFRVHAEQAKQSGGGIVGAPPIIKGDYEAYYKFLDQNVVWAQPPYELWEPDLLPQWLRGLHDADVPYCIVSHYRQIEGFEPAFEFTAGYRPLKIIYGYSNAARTSSLRAVSNKSAPFLYDAVSPQELSGRETVQIIAASTEHANFLKDVYQQRGIFHSNGHMRYFVYLNGKLAGCFVYKKSRIATRRPSQIGNVYLLSDFSITRERRISKLIAMLATGRDQIEIVRKHFMAPVDVVDTSAFSRSHVSMKYRGIFKLKSRTQMPDGRYELQYTSAVREKSNAEIYREWFRRYARDASPPSSGDET